MDIHCSHQIIPLFSALLFSLTLSLFLAPDPFIYLYLSISFPSFMHASSVTLMKLFINPQFSCHLFTCSILCPLPSRLCFSFSLHLSGLPPLSLCLYLSISYHSFILVHYFTPNSMTITVHPWFHVLSFLSIYLYLFYSPPPSTCVSHLNRQSSHQITDQSFLSLYHIPPLTSLFSHLL